MEKEELYLKGAKIGEIRNNCYVSYRTHLHMFHIFNDGFGISEKVLDYLFTKNVKHILINFEDRFLLNSDIDTFLVKAKEYSDNGDKQLILEGQFWNKETRYKHPTQKPLNLMIKLIKENSKETDIILDCFIGTGSTIVGCKSLNRKFIGFEISQEYCDIANKRLAQEVLNV